MNSKTCGECKYFVTSDYLDVCVVYCETQRADRVCNLCDEFKPRVVTNGDRIIAGGIRAIAEFAGNPCEYCRYYKDFCELPDGKMCEDAIEEYLNAPAGKDNNVPAKQRDGNDGLTECENCGRTYHKKKKAQRFCSIKCKDKWWNRERSADGEYLHPQCEDNFNGDA